MAGRIVVAQQVPTIMSAIDQYLEEVAQFAGNHYGKLMRQSFPDQEGKSELAMLVVPTAEELEELRRAVAIMTPGERDGAAALSDTQVQRIAEDAKADPANFAIFINGYVLHCNRASP